MSNALVKMSVATVMTLTLAAAPTVATAQPLTGTPGDPTPAIVAHDLPAPTVAEAAQALQEGVRDGSIPLSAATDDVDWARTSVFASDGTILASAPLGGLTAGSNLTVAFTPDWSVVASSEAHYAAIDETSGRATIWVDGVREVDRVFEADEMADGACPATAGSASEGGPGARSLTATLASSADSFWSRINDCLSSAGVSAWIVAAAGFACGLGGPVGMAVCLAGAGVGAGTASYCVRYALDNG